MKVCTVHQKLYYELDYTLYSIQYTALKAYIYICIIYQTKYIGSNIYFYENNEEILNV